MRFVSSLSEAKRVGMGTLSLSVTSWWKKTMAGMKHAATPGSIILAMSLLIVEPKFLCYPVAMRGETMGATSEVR